MKEIKRVKKIKESITEVEFKKSMTFCRGDENIKVNTKKNLLRTFTILYYTGMRLNEVQELQVKHIKDLIKNGSVKIYISKTNTERKLYLTPSFKKELFKLFDFNFEDINDRVITKGSNKTNKTGINNIVFIQQINTYIKNILGDGFTSHSFRQGIITEMGFKSINTKIIANFIGHKSVKTTMGYIKPTEAQIIDSLIR